MDSSDVNNTTDGPQNLTNNDSDPLESKEGLAGSSSERDKEDSDGEFNADRPRQRKQWSELLQSPRGTQCFSPSLDLSKPESLHGIGMRFASSKSRSIGEVAHRALVFLMEITNLYDQVGLVGFKCLQLLQPSQENLFPQILRTESNELKITLESYSISTRQLAEYIRMTILTPLEDSLTSNGTIVTNSNQRYNQVRQQCNDTRSKALSAEKAYLKAVKNAEYSFESWKKARETTPPSNAIDLDSISNELEGWEKALTQLGANVPNNTNSLIQLLKTAKSCETRYCDLVRKENKLVEEAHEVEILGLDEIQAVVERRLGFFVNSMGRNILNFDYMAIRNVKITPVEERSLKSFQSALQDKKIDGAMFLNNLFKQQNLKSYDGGMGVMEAETLGLTEETGKVRDKVQVALISRSSRIKVVQTLKSVLEELAAAHSRFAFSLKMKAQTGKINPAQVEKTLRGVAMTHIGQNSVDLFESILRVLQTEAESTSACVVELSTISTSKLDPFLDSAAQNLEAVVAAEDFEWKQLCEASRSESKTESRFNQLKSQLERVRDRTTSTDSASTPVLDDGESKTSDEADEKPVGSSSPLPSRMSKFGSMLAGNDAIKKLAGNDAIKKLQENAMNTITKLTDEKIGKERQTRDEASAVKNQALAKYLSNAKQRYEQLESQDNEGWKDLTSTIDTVVKIVHDLLKARQTARTSSEASRLNITTEKILEDIDEWLDSSKTKIIEAEQDGFHVTSKTTSGKDNGFALNVALVESAPVETLLSLEGEEKDIASLGIGQIVWPKGKESSNDSEEPDTKDKSDGSEDSPPRNNGHIALHRTLTAPIKSATQGLARVGKQQNPFEDTKTEDDTDTFSRQFFAKAFWSQRDDKVPTIKRTLPCTYRVKEKGSFLIPPVQGRVFSTEDSMYFLALDGKKLSLPWTKVISIEVEKGLLGSNEKKSIVLCYESEAGNEAAFVLGRLESRDAALEHFRELHNQNQNGDDVQSENAATESVTPVPPDKTIKKMQTVLSRPIKGASITDVYEKIWSEGIKTSEKPFYGPWLNTEGCFEVQLGDWEFASDDQGFVNPWDKERYTQKRLIKFKFKRTTHLYIGPPIANVIQQQYCRVEGNDKCVMAMCVTFDGVPYADTFAVEVRWIAIRQGSKDVKIEVGLFVDFRKRTMLSSKIETGTISETKNVHNRLFEAVKNACATSDIGVSDSDSEVEENDEEVLAAPKTSLFDLPLLQKFAICVGGPVIAYAILKFGFGGGRSSTLGVGNVQLLLERIDGLQKDVNTLQKTVDALTIMLKERR